MKPYPVFRGCLTANLMFGAWLVCLVVILAAASAHAEERPSILRECLQRAIQAAQDIEDGGLREFALTQIALTQAHALDVAGARLLLKEIEDDELAASVLEAIGHAQAKSGDHAEAKATLTQALARTQQVLPKRSGELLLYGILLAHVAARQFHEAHELALLFEANHVYRIHGMISIAEGRLEAGQREQASGTLQEAARAALKPGHPGPLSSAWERIVEIYLKLDDVSGALKFTRGLPQDHYQRCRSLCEIASHQARAGDVAAAKSTLSEAVQVAQKMSNEGEVRNIHLASIVWEQVDVGDLDGAIKTMQLIPDSYHKVGAFEAVARAYAKAGNKEGGRKTLEQAIAMVERSIDDTYLKAESFASIAVAQAEAGENEAATETMAKALEAAREGKFSGWYHAVTFCEVAEAQVQIGDRESAAKTFEEAVQLARQTEDAEGRAEEAEGIATIQIATGYNAAARITIREILLPVILARPKPEHNLSEAACLLAKAGDFSYAYETARAIENDYYRRKAVRSAAAYHTMSGGVDEAQVVAEKEADPLVKSEMYLGTALGLLKSRGVVVRNHYGLALVEE